MKKKCIIAGIVTYNPELKRLKENISSIIKQVDEIIIIDNGSDNINMFDEFVSSSIQVHLNKKNEGIATALNQIMDYAKKNDVEWVITLDQDSVVPENYISSAKEIMSNGTVGQIVPLLYESRTKQYCYLSDKPNGQKVQIVQKSITSAAITNVLAWEKVGKFDDKLFIDYVDYDYAMRLRIAGYKIVRLNTIILNHQMGNSVNKNVGPFVVRVANHSSFRKYYIARNIVIFMRRYKLKGCLFSEMLRLCKVIIVTMAFEEDKKNKMKAIFRGIQDGLRYKI